MSHTYLLNGTTNPAIVAGQVTAVQVSQDAVWVVFHNVSVNTDILLSLGVANPGPTSTPGGEWPYVCPAGHSIKVPVPGQSQTGSASGPWWQGKLWILPINQSSQQAITGKQPPIGNLWIMTFGVGETPAEVSPSTQAVSQVGQQRVIAVPVGVQNTTDAWAPVAAGDRTIATFGVNAAIIAAQSVVFYVYGFSMYPTAVAASTGHDFTLWMDVVNGVSSILISSKLCEGIVTSGPTANGTISPFTFPPATVTASYQSVGWAGTAAGINIRVHTNGIFGSPFVKTNLMAFPDDLNPATINNPIGGFFTTALF